MRWAAIILGVSWLSLGGAGATSLRAERPLRVSVAISLREAAGEIAAAFEKQDGGRVELVFGSSGQLLAQIRSGAAVDVFISAASEQVEVLIQEKLADEPARRVVALNRLVLITPAADRGPTLTFHSLAEHRLARVAIGEPDTVPAGLYARQVLEKLKLLDGLKSRLVYGTNVRQVLDYVERGEVDAGVVYATDARLVGDKVRVHAIAEADWHEPIEYPAIVLRRCDRPEAATAFVAFFESDAARKILESHGFALPRRPTDEDPRSREAQPPATPKPDSPP